MSKLSLYRIIAIVLGVVIVVLALSFTINAQTVPAPLNFKKGTKIWFDVSKEGEAKHNLYLTIVAMKPDIITDWTTDETTPRKGHVTISRSGSEVSRSLTSDFKDGTDKTNAGFLWMNKGLFNELAFGKTMYSKDDNPKMAGLVNSGKEKITISVNGKNKSLEVIHGKSISSGNDDEYWILNDENNPLVIKAFISGKTIQIKQITL